jgi:DNA mismatch repair ATPase MutS
MFNFFKNRQREKIREAWKNPSRWDRGFDSISSLFEATSSDYKSDIVDEKTWNDLDMNAVFRKIDTTQTSIGQQYLYRKMRLLQKPNGKLEDGYRVVTLLRENSDIREELQLCLKAVKESDAKIVTSMLFGGLTIVHLPKLAVLLWSLISLATIVSAVLAGGGFLLLIPVIFIVNFAISHHFEDSTDRITYVFYYLYNVATTSEKLAKLETLHDIPEHQELKMNRNSIRKIRNVLKLLSINQNHDGIITNNLMYFLNLVILYDLIVYSFSIQKILLYQEIIKKCYLAIGAIDTNISIASYTRRNENICNPKLDFSHAIELVDAYHPLVEDYVANSFTSTGSSALITGSNMAGKTTFIKTIGVNLILARTLWFCHAAQANLPVIDVFSSIKTEDGIEEGKSFYFSELERLNRFLKITEKGGNCLFLIDEIYRGTNTVERIAGAAAVLQELASGNIVFVTTHDTELATYLNKQYEMWYFEETGSRTHPFDYALRPGVCKTRNALKLMSNMGYPEHITKLAAELARKMEDKG